MEGVYYIRLYKPVTANYIGMKGVYCIRLYKPVTAAFVSLNYKQIRKQLNKVTQKSDGQNFQESNPNILSS